MPAAPSSRQRVACLCAGVTHDELQQAIAADRGASVESLGAALGCGVQCGSCVPAIKEALGEVAWFAASARAVAITRSRNVEGLERLIFRVELSLRPDAQYPAVQPGQHVVLRAHTGEGLVERTYTVVAQDHIGRKLALGIRRTPGGKLTPWLLDAGEATSRELEVSVPGGPRLGSAGRRPDVFFAAGVGITPAVAMVYALPETATMHLHYSVSDADDAAFLPQFDARRKHCPHFSYSVRQTSSRGPITDSKVGLIAAEFPDARFYVCGPSGYVDLVRRALRRAGIAAGRIHVELFEVSSGAAPVRTPRLKAYAAGALLMLTPLLLLLPAVAEIRPHGHPNVGHAQLQCASCHVETTATLRQTLQAKARHVLGWRQTGAVLGTLPVTSATCLQCHANPDDRHPPNRFLEPRFEQARAQTGAQLCASCHREHSAVRVTVPSGGYCVSCHADLKVKNDRASPTHDYLVQGKQWSTCLQCHDYHGNHKWRTPLRLQDANALDAIDRYLQGGPSPFGATVAKAKQEVH